METKNSLSKATRKEVILILNAHLALVTDLYSQTKQAHWNVRGEHFYAQHKLFDDLAESVEGYIDTIAERVTALGGFANGTVRQAAAESKLPEFPVKQGSSKSFLEALSERFAIAANAVRKAVDKADQLGDAGSADLLTGLLRELDKGLWFLEAHRL
jgi:starvation-inducible DNA-binding protein